VFLHKIKEGAADKSYGIHVAELAELPKELIERAKEILAQLEHHGKQETAVSVEQKVAEMTQLSFFEEDPLTKSEEKVSYSKKEKKVLDEIRAIDLLEMTPIAALNKLYELQKQLKN
jgi:DNA mismatch repair protein MutS